MKSNTKIYQSKNSVQLRLNSKLLCKQLCSLGCFPKKSQKITSPKNLPTHYYSDFTRGYFDGDGSIMFNKPNVIKVNFSGNKNFINKLIEVISNSINVSPAKIRENKKKFNSVWQIYFYGDNARKLFD